MNKTIAQVWTFASGSNPSKSYETLQYTDGSTSCNCRGWCMHVPRSCKHTKAVENGTATGLSMGHTSYQAQGAAKQTPVYTPAKPVTKPVALPSRRVSWR